MTLLSLIGRWLKVPVRFRTLFWGFVSNEIRGRFAGSIGGFVWSLLTPLANLLIYIFVFSVVLQIRLKPMETGTDSFAVFFLAGMLPWLAFSEALNGSTDLFLGRANLITKISFPLELLPLTGVIVPFFLNGLGFVMYLGYLVLKGYAHVGWLWLPVVIAVHMAFTLGLVILISSLTVFLRDIKQFIGIVISLWFFLTPIIYPLGMVPQGYRWLIKFNPMYPFIELYHQVLLQGTFSWAMLGYAIGLGAILLGGAILFFERSKYAFADVL
ncbi:MAG: ABC transporter permease [Deltaproteobacteria bacterium]|nr:ABC transporter permease [Deltaproteobacteria bacterium]